MTSRLNIRPPYAAVILQLEKPRPREVDRLTQSPTVSSGLKEKQTNNPNTILCSKGRNVCRGPHLGTTIYSFSEQDVLLGLGTSVPVLGWDILRLSPDAAFASREITVYFDSIHSASLVRVDPVVTF